MKNFFILKRFTSCSLAQGTGSPLGPIELISVAALLIACVAPLFVSQAQRLYVPVRVSSISAQSSNGGTVVTIAADSSLGRAQTWQDDEGYHAVLPNTVAVDSLKTVRGVKVRRIGSSLEVLVQTRPGVRAAAQLSHNHINITVDGKLEARPTDSVFQVESTSSEERQLFEDPRYGTARTEAIPLKFSSPVEDLAASSRSPETGQAAGNSSASNASGPAPTPSNSSEIVPQGDGTTPPQPPPSEITVHPSEGEEGFMASVFSGTSVLIVLAVGLLGLLVSRKLRSRQTVTSNVASSSVEDTAWDEREDSEANSRATTPAVSKSLVKAIDNPPANGSSRQAVARLPVAGPTSLYGAYRIDQEVGKLILGQPHRIDVLASRAIDDRRAIETSLIKGVNSPELDENARRRAREALEEYGFVARQCATLLLAPDAFERTSAARSLGEIKSPAALPFLLEGLYDSESIVRNQAVVSIGELKLPSAIGALLDIARTHPDVPSALLSRTLSSCSVEGLDFFDAVVPGAALLGSGSVGSVVEEITHLESAVPIESLPESSDDQRFLQTFSSLESIDSEERSEALKTLAQFRVQTAVSAISQVARHDSDPAIRSLAISSLGSINHESVFPAVLIGMADDSREVRAAAARSLNRLSFDRADAYVRVIESGDDETIRNVAKACIQAGIVSQNLDRLSDSDHRQAYETFSLICLLAQARMNEPILDAILEHPRIDVRLKAVHLIACTNHPDTFEKLRDMTVKDGIHEEVRTALLEVMYKLDQGPGKSSEEPPVETFVADNEPALEADETQSTEGNCEPKFEAKVQPELDEFEF